MLTDHGFKAGQFPYLGELDFEHINPGIGRQPTSHHLLPSALGIRHEPNSRNEGYEDQKLKCNPLHLRES